MKFRARFVAGLAWRALLMLATAFGFVASLSIDGLGAARILAGALCLWAVWALWRYIQRTNRELARYLEAVRLGDFSQSFSQRGGSGFTEIGETPVDGDVYRELLRSYDEGVAEFLGLERVKPNTLGNTRMLLHL